MTEREGRSAARERTAEEGEEREEFAVFIVCIGWRSPGFSSVMEHLLASVIYCEAKRINKID